LQPKTVTSCSPFAIWSARETSAVLFGSFDFGVQASIKVANTNEIKIVVFIINCF
jgi:hypothetical protein